MAVTKATEAYSDSIPYMEPRIADFENALAWAGIVVSNLWKPYAVVSHPTKGRSTHESRLSV